MTAPLEGLRVWITRPSASAAASAQTWREAGADAVAVPLVRLSARTPSAADLGRLAAVAQPWNVVLTSQNAARFLVEALEPHPVLRDALRAATSFAVGGATARRARDLGLSVDDTASRATGADLARLLTERLRPGERVLLPGSDQQRPEVGDELSRAGIDVTSVVVYHTLPVSSIERALAAELASSPGPLILLYSPSAVHALGGILEKENASPAQVTVAVVGPTTGRAAAEAGLQVVVAPENPGDAALVESVAAWWSGHVS